MKKTSVANTDFSKMGNKDNRERLFNTTAREVPDRNAENELKQFVGKSGVPPEPYGKKGRQF